MYELTRFERERDPISTITILFNVISKLRVFLRRPRPSLHLCLVATWSSSHVLSLMCWRLEEKKKRESVISYLLFKMDLLSLWRSSWICALLIRDLDLDSSYQLLILLLLNYMEEKIIYISFSLKNYGCEKSTWLTCMHMHCACLKILNFQLL